MSGVAAVVGHPARDAYREETGFRPLGALSEPSRALSPAELRIMVENVRNLVGSQAFDACEATHRRGQVSPTPPLQSHRLMMLADYVLETAGKMEAAEAWEMPVWPVIELHTIIGILERWRHHPVWPALRAVLLSEFEHTVAHLVMASYLVDAGNGVGIGAPEGRIGVKVPDMWVQADVSKRLSLEVKTPVRLRGPRPTMPEGEAVKLLVSHLKRTVSGAHGQLSGGDGILAICGFSLERADLDVLESTARSLLGSRAHRHVRFVGIVLATVGFTSQDDGRAIAGSADIRLVMHPGYKGDLKVDQTHPNERASSAFDVA
jgi:hypothetical protein